MSGRLQNFFRGGRRREPAPDDLRSVDLYDARTHSLRRGERLGFAIHPNVPIPVAPIHFRGREEILLCFLELSKQSSSPTPDHSEALWTLAWCLGLVGKFSFAEACDLSLLRCLREFAVEDSGSLIRRKMKPRTARAIFMQLDLARCLDSIIRKALQSGGRVPKSVDPQLLQARLNTLEWVFTDSIGANAPLP